jgi:hypothetical protein
MAGWTRSFTASEREHRRAEPVEALRRHKRDVKFFAVEPAESPVLGGGQSGPHNIEGVGIGYTPPLWNPSLAGWCDPGADGPTPKK